jgi:hypothetical protein
MLAGKEYPVPPLVPRQLREVVPAIMKSAMALGDIRNATPEAFQKLLEVIYWGIIWINDPNRNNPSTSIKFTILDEMPIGMPEIMEAVRLVQKQTGLYSRTPSFAVTWESLGDAAAEWRAGQRRDAVGDASPINNEDIEGALALLVKRSAKGADTPGEAATT